MTTPPTANATRLADIFDVHPSIIGRVNALFHREGLTPTPDHVSQVLALHSRRGLSLDLHKALSVSLLLRAVTTCGMQASHLTHPALLNMVLDLGRTITRHPDPLATYDPAAEMLAVIDLARTADLDLASDEPHPPQDHVEVTAAQPTDAIFAPDPTLSTSPVLAPVITPHPTPAGTNTPSDLPASLHADASAAADQTATSHTWTEIDTTPDAAPPAHPVTDAPRSPVHTWTEIDTTPDQPSKEFIAPAHAWTDVDTTPDTPSLNPVPAAIPTHAAAISDPTPTVHLSGPTEHHAAPSPAPAHEAAADLTADEVTEPMTGDSVTATTTLTFTAFPAAPAPSVDAEDTATLEPHATPAAAHPTFHKNAVTAPAASGSVAASDAHLTPAAEPPMITPDTAPLAMASPVVTQVIDAPAGEPLPDGPAGGGPLPWVAANRDATPEEVMAYLTDHQDVDGVLVSLEALQPFRLYMLDLEAFYRDNPHQKAGADLKEIREIARVAQEVLLTITTLTEEDFALLAPEARIIIESAARLLA